MSSPGRSKAVRDKAAAPATVLRRGDFCTVALQGDFGKPRPVLVLQQDAFNPTHATITVALLSTHIVSTPLFRITIDPTPENKLEQVSQVQIDKITSVGREKLSAAFGRIDLDTMVRVNRALALWLGLA